MSTVAVVVHVSLFITLSNLIIDKDAVCTLNISICPDLQSELFFPIDLSLNYFQHAFHPILICSSQIIIETIILRGKRRRIAIFLL